MLTSIVKATKRHYAALQHREAPDRIRLNYLVREGVVTLNAGYLWVKAANNSRRHAEMTKLMNRLHAMYPEATEVSTDYGKSGVK